MKNRYIGIATSIGLIAILTLQTIWLFHTYNLIEGEIKNKCNNLFEKAVGHETFIRFGQVPIGTQVIGLPRSKAKNVIPDNVFIQEELSKLGHEISLPKLDSIYCALLKAENLPAQNSIIRLLTKEGKTLQSTGKSKGFGAIETKICFIRVDESQGVQAVLINPYWTIFQRMGLLMIATVIMMILVITCIIYQIKIINRQNKIAKMREDFSYAMIHDMKTPLTSILTGTRILHSGKLTDQPKIDKHFRIVEEEAEHLLLLTDKVLTISKLEKHQLDLEKDIVPLEPMIADLVEKFSAKSPKATFTVQLQTDSVYADSEYLKEAISNLIDNSIKYSREQVQIDISAEDTVDEYTLIRVRDNGIGIAPEDQKKIFEKFERAAAFGRTKKGGAGGFGLGLNYVQNITEAHGGRVLLESIETEFSEFQLYIPHSTKEL